MSVFVPTPDELKDLLVAMLTGAAGGTEEKWRAAIGEVEKLSTATNVRSNWRVRPAGNEKDLDAIDRAVDIVRVEHPYVARK